jgi:hypothetical protein
VRSRGRTRGPGPPLPHGLPSYVVVALAGTLGYLLGALAGWELGRRGGRPLIERHGRWLHLDARRLMAAERLVRAPRPRGGVARAADAHRAVVHLDPAGVLESPLVPYTLLTLAGSAIWCFGFAGVGWALGSRYDQVHHAFTGVEVALVAARGPGPGRRLRRPALGSRRSRVTPARGLRPISAPGTMSSFMGARWPRA